MVPSIGSTTQRTPRSPRCSRPPRTTMPSPGRAAQDPVDDQALAGVVDLGDHVGRRRLRAAPSTRGSSSRASESTAASAARRSASSAQLERNRSRRRARARTRARRGRGRCSSRSDRSPPRGARPGPRWPRPGRRSRAAGDQACRASAPRRPPSTQRSGRSGSPSQRPRRAPARRRGPARGRGRAAVGDRRRVSHSICRRVRRSSASYSPRLNSSSPVGCSHAAPRLESRSGAIATSA